QPMARVCAAVFVFYVVGAAVCTAGVIDVYIVAGQSKADGRGTTSELVGSLAKYQAAQSDVLMRYTNPGNSNGTNAYQSNWTPLAPGFAVPPGYQSALPSSRFGPEVSFGYDVAQFTTDRKVAIIKVTRGGTNLYSQWDPTDTPGDPKGHMY